MLLPPCHTAGTEGRRHLMNNLSLHWETNDNKDLQQKFNKNDRKQWSSYLSYILFGVLMLEVSPRRPKQQGLRRSSCFTTSQNGLANLKTHSFFWVHSTSWAWLATIRWRWQWRCCTYASFLSTSKPAYMDYPLFIKSLADCNECMQIFKLIEKCLGWKNLLAKIDGGSEKWLNLIVDEVCTFTQVHICALILFYMDAGLGAGEAEDRNSHKYDRLHYACLNSFNPPITFHDDKSAYHSFNHIQIAELLCPIYHLTEFAEDTCML